MQTLLITGHRKSGTSLLNKIFDGHPDLNLYPTDVSLLYAFFPFFTAKFKNNPTEYNKRLFKILKMSLTNAAKAFGAKSSQKFPIQNLYKKLKLISSKNRNNCNEILRLLSKSWAEITKRKSCKYIVFKETSQVVYFPSLIKNNFPKKIIIVVRDPRDNFAAIRSGVKSYYSKYGETVLSSLASSINRIKADLSLLLEYNNKKNIYICKFENLTNNPKKELNKICKFLKITFNKSLSEPSFYGKKAYGNNFDGKKFKRISNENVGNYKSRLDQNEIHVIEWFLRDEMIKLGYLKKGFSLSKSHLTSIRDFYSWYNYKYFYKDSFK